MSILTSDNAAYHADTKYLSSSAIKMLLKDPKEYYNRYVLKLDEQEDKPAFAEGHFVHSLILEPETVSKYVVYPGIRRQGAKWDEFRALNPNKTILTMGQVARCENLYKNYSSMPVAKALIEKGIAEHTMLSKIIEEPVKARADYINIEDGYIVDVKTTSLPSGAEYFQQAIADYKYDLSAALYCQIAHDNYKKLFDFYWLVLSKYDYQCHVYKASSNTLSEGAAKVIKGIALYKQCVASGIWSLEQPKKQFDTKEYEIIII